MKKLGEILDIERGASPRPISAFTTNSPDGENWIKIGDTKSSIKYVTQTAEKITKAGAAKSRRVEIGDFILSNSMSFGRPYITKITGYIHDGWLRLSIKDDKQLLADYLYIILGSVDVQQQFEHSATGGVVRNLNSELVKNIQVPVPPLKIQKEYIAASTAEQKIISSVKSLIELMESKMNSTLAEICNG